MKGFVLDVSACMPWCCEDETTAASEEMLEWAMSGSELHVPSLWVWEILNVVAVTVKRRRITADRARPSGVRGPVDLAALARLAAICSGE